MGILFLVVVIFGVGAAVVAGQNQRSTGDNSTDKKSLYHRRQSTSKPENALHEKDKTTNTVTVEHTKGNFMERLVHLTDPESLPRQRTRRNISPEKTRRPRQEKNNSTHRSGMKAIQLRVIEDQYSHLNVNSVVGKMRWWRPVDWCEGHTSKFFAYDEHTGDIRIKCDGLYYVYAQVTYKNLAQLNKYEVKVNETKTLFSCTQERVFPQVSKPSTTPIMENCHAGTVTWLQANQNISIWNSCVNHRPIDPRSQATFWGVMRIGQLY